MIETLKRALAGLTVFATAAALAGGPAFASSHAEAPLISMDRFADNTDTYAFRSVEPGRDGYVTLIANYIPLQEPSGGPQWFRFDDTVLYEIKIDNTGDGREDISYQFQFNTTIKNGETVLGQSAVNHDAVISNLGDPDYNMPQTYSVRRVDGNSGSKGNLIGSDYKVPPANIGPRVTPDYEMNLGQPAIGSLPNGGRVFAGNRDEYFYIDLGVFDALNLRSTTSESGGIDSTKGYNVSTIAIEVPISSVTAHGSGVIGAYASMSRQKVRVLKEAQDDKANTSAGPWVQVSRMANPLVNELIIGTDRKDRWNATDPSVEAQFLGFYLNSRLATAINLRFGTNIPTTNRTDLVNALLKYPSQPQSGTCGRNDCSELLRLNLAVAPTPPAQQKRLTILAGDAAGWPNGRRPNDDVTDIALRVVAGKLVGTPEGNLALGDGVNFNIGAEGSNLTGNGIYTVFPYLPTPHDGRNRRHIDCEEPGANACN